MPRRSPSQTTFSPGSQSVMRGLQRQEQTEYPETVVREALVNAVAHRDYRMTGGSIEIRMYSDRMEIMSPGGLPAHITARLGPYREAVAYSLIFPVPSPAAPRQR